MDLVTAPLASVLDGRADACVTSVRALLAASGAAGRPVPARFLGVVHQRSPIAAMVRADSHLRQPRDLGGRRLAVSRFGWFLAEFEAALVHAGAGLPTLVPVPVDDAQSPLGRGEVDMIASWSELVPWARRRAGVDVRPVEIGPPVYTTGLVASDRMSGQRAARLTAALAEALAQPRAAVTAGLAGCAEGAPRVAAADVVEEWSRLAPNLSGPHGPATMTASRWAVTVDMVPLAPGTRRPELAEICRPELLAPDYAAAGA